MANTKPDNTNLHIDLKNKISRLEQLDSARIEERKSLYTIYKWRAPDRLLMPKSREWYASLTVVFLVAIAFSVLLGEYLLMFAIIAVMILTYISQSINPKLIDHEITNKGLLSSGKLYTWDKIDGFWISKRGTSYILIIDLKPNSRMPSRLIILAGAASPKVLVEYLYNHIPYFDSQEAGIDLINVFTTGNHTLLTDWIQPVDNRLSEEN